MTENEIIDNIYLHKAGLDELYIGCRFEACDFSEMVFGKIHFEDCVFKQCNLSMTKMFCKFNNTQFMECKIVGTEFSGINKFSDSFRFIKSNLSYVSFYEMKLRDVHFVECAIVECDFTGADLSCAIFEHSDLARSLFVETNLEKANLETSYNWVVNPTLNNTNNMIISESELRGLVAHLRIIIK